MGVWRFMTERLNFALSHENIGRLDETLVAKLGTTGPLDEFLTELKICNEEELRYLKSWPEGLREVLRAAIRSAVHRSPRVPVNIAWAPGYDFEINVWEAPATADSPPSMTILMRGRYPADRHPAAR